MGKSREKLFYGWWIVLTGFILMFCIYAVFASCTSLFVKPVTEDLNFTRSQFSLYFTIAALSMLVSVGFMGKLLSKKNTKVIMLVCAVITSVGFMAFSLANQLIHFYLIALVLGAGLSGVTIVPISMLINNWFKDKKGLATGLAFTGSGIGGMVFSPLINWIIINYGWRNAYLIVGIIMFTLSTPTIAIFVKKHPSEKGLAALGAEKAKDGTVNAVVNGVTAKEAVKMKSFWIFMIGFMLITLTSAGMLMHIPSYLSDIGYSSTFAANVISMALGVMAISKIVLGGIFDKFGTTKVVLSACIVFTFSIITLLIMNNIAAVGAFIILFGFGGALATVAPPILISEAYGNKDYGTIFGYATIVISLGGALGGPIAAKVYDVFGSYNYAWLSFVFLSILTMFALLAPLKLNKNIECTVE